MGRRGAAGARYGLDARDHGPGCRFVCGRLGADDGGDDAARCGAVRVAVLAHLHRRPRLPAGCVRLRLPDRVDPGGPARLRAGVARRPARGRQPRRGDRAGGGYLHRLRRLPAHPAEGPVPGPLPLAARIHAQARRLPRAHPRPAGRALPRHILPGLLLGPDGRPGCLRADERDRHGGPGRRRSRRKDLGPGARFSRALGIAALALAIAVIFEPGLAPGLHYTAGTGGMGGM